jgi:hypothetical protein
LGLLSEAVVIGCVHPPQAGHKRGEISALDEVAIAGRRNVLIETTFSRIGDELSSLRSQRKTTFPESLQLHHVLPTGNAISPPAYGAGRCHEGVVIPSHYVNIHGESLDLDPSNIPPDTPVLRF